MPQLAKMQLACANLVVVNKIDLVSAEQLNRVLSWLQVSVTNTSIMLATHGRVRNMDTQEIETFEKES